MKKSLQQSEVSAQTCGMLAATLQEMNPSETLQLIFVIKESTIKEGTALLIALTSESIENTPADKALCLTRTGEESRGSQTHLPQFRTTSPTTSSVQ